MKWSMYCTIIVTFLVTILYVSAYSTYGSPAEFGNASLTTCYVGGDNGIVNCTGQGIFNTLIAGSVTGNVTANWNTMINIPSGFDDDTDDNTNCSTDQSCSPIIYDTDESNLNVNDSVYWGGYNISHEWLTPTQILDVDDEDVETDLNTYWDIAGDTDSGSYLFDFPNSNLTVGLLDGNLSCTNITGATSDLCTLVDTTDGNCSVTNSCTDIIYSGNTSWVTANEADAAHDECSEITNCVVGAITSIVSDTSPQLGGFLDANGQNIGAGNDEIRNVYIGSDYRIYMGNGQEVEMYYDTATTRLVIKVN